MNDKTRQQGAILDEFCRPSNWGNISMFTAQPKRHYFDVEELAGKTIESYQDVDGDGLWCLALVCERQYVGTLHLQGNVDPRPMHAICAAAVFKGVIPKGIRYIALASSDAFRGGRMGDSKKLGELLNSHDIPVLFDEGGSALSVYYANTLCKLGTDILAYFTLKGANLTYSQVLPHEHSNLYPICKIAGYSEIYDLTKNRKLIPDNTSRAMFPDIIDVLSYAMISTKPPINVTCEEKQIQAQTDKWKRYIVFHGYNVIDEELKHTTEMVCDMLEIWKNRLADANLSFSDNLNDLGKTQRLAEVGRVIGIDRDIAALIAKVPISDIICT